MSQTAEYRTVVAKRDILVTAISIDSLTVANKLITRELVPPESISQHETEQQIATQLVDKVTRKILIDSRNFRVFWDALNEIDIMSDVVEQLQVKFEEIMEDFEPKVHFLLAISLP